MMIIAPPTARASGPPYSWTGPVNVNPVVGIDILPTAMRAADGTLWLAWQTYRYSSARPDIIYNTYNGTAWVGPVGRLTSSGYNTSPALAQLQNGTIMLFWSLQSTTNFNIYYKRFNLGTWSSSVHLTVTTSYNDTSPSATVNPTGTLWLFWTRANQTCAPTCVQTKQVYYKTLTGNAWSSETGLTSDSNWNWMPSATSTKDGNVRLAFSKGGQVVGSTNTNQQIYDTFYNGIAWSPETLRVNSPTNSDQHPSIMQDRNGTQWLFWARIQSGTSPTFVLFNKYSIDNGQNWSAETQMTNEASGIDSQQPVAVQANTATDKTIHLFYSSDRGANLDYDIWQLQSEPISPVHDVAIASQVFVSNNLVYAGGLASIGQSAIIYFTLTVNNLGDSAENLQIVASVSNTTIISLGTQTGTVALGGSLLVTFAFNTTNVKPARYIFNATVTSGTPETAGNSVDNSVSVRNAVHVIPWGDVDQNGIVTLTDVSIFFYNFGFTPATPGRWNPFCDINNNGIIDLVDTSIAVRNFGMTS